MIGSDCCLVSVLNRADAMAEYMPASILIGGQLDADQVAELHAAVARDGAVYADDGGIANESELADLIDGAGPLHLIHVDASWGKLPALEAACEMLGLTYQRRSDAKYDYEAEIVSWAPGMTEPRWTQGSQAGAAMTPLDAVRDILDAPGASDAEIVARLRAELAGQMPVVVPPLRLRATA